MSEIELFEAELKIDKNCYEIIADDDGHIVKASFYDEEYMRFNYPTGRSFQLRLKMYQASSLMN